jgi:DNA-binding beta-propeller fold protein YncE
MRSGRRGIHLALACALSGAIAGCAGTQKVDEKPPEWPLPPDPPRIRFVRGFANEHELGGGAWGTLRRAFVPADPGLTIAQPTGLALTPDEKLLYVTSNAGGKTLVVDLANSRMRRFANEEGKRPRAPFGVAVDADGNVYISDHVGAEVWVYAPDGSFLRKFGDGKLDRATGIAIDRRRQVVYVTAGATSRTEHHRVEVFSLKGQHLRTIGTRGGDPGNFNVPANLAVSNDGRLWVVDMLNFRVQIFDPDGQLVGMFGSIGAGRPGTFDKAKSISFDAFGNIYVVDSHIACVQLFNTKFQPLMAFGGRGKEPGYFLMPTAIAIDSRNHIFVADFGAGRVNEYVLINTTAGDSLDGGGAKGGGTPSGAAAPAPAAPPVPAPR